MRGSYTHIIEQAESSFREASRFASGMINYSNDRFNANLIATWFGQRETPSDEIASGRVTLDDAWLLFGKMSYNITSNWQVFLQAKNLLDKEFLTPASSSRVAEGTPNRGRELLLGLTVSF